MANHQQDAASSVRQALKALDIQRQSLEQESGAIVSELTAVNPAKPTVPPMGIDTPLTDREGYPRNDIDVYRARALRGRLAEIKTDHKKLMLEMERNLHQLALLQNTDKSAEEAKEAEARQQVKPKPKYDPVTGKWVVRNWDGTIAGAGQDSTGRSFDNLTASAAPPPVATTTGVSNLSIRDEPVLHKAAEISSVTPFCRVDSVAPASPASAAGLKVNDQILAFGPHTSMSAVAELVKSAATENAAIELRIQRNDDSASGAASTKTILLKLEPKPWNGRGLLGCHILPV